MPFQFFLYVSVFMPLRWSVEALCHCCLVASLDFPIYTRLAETTCSSSGPASQRMGLKAGHPILVNLHRITPVLDLGAVRDLVQNMWNGVHSLARHRIEWEGLGSRWTGAVEIVLDERWGKSKEREEQRVLSFCPTISGICEGHIA